LRLKPLCHDDGIPSGFGVCAQRSLSAIGARTAVRSPRRFATWDRTLVKSLVDEAAETRQNPMQGSMPAYLISFFVRYRLKKRQYYICMTDILMVVLQIWYQFIGYPIII
jgi:hypothetical protein